MSKQLSSFALTDLTPDQQALLDKRGIGIHIFREAWGVWEIQYILKKNGFWSHGGKIEEETKEAAINKLLKLARDK